MESSDIKLYHIHIMKKMTKLAAILFVSAITLTSLLPQSASAPESESPPSHPASQEFIITNAYAAGEDILVPQEVNYTSLIPDVSATAIIPNTLRTRLNLIYKDTENNFVAEPTALSIEAPVFMSTEPVKDTEPEQMTQEEIRESAIDQEPDAKPAIPLDQDTEEPTEPKPITESDPAPVAPAPAADDNPDAIPDDVDRSGILTLYPDKPEKLGEFLGNYKITGYDPYCKHCCYRADGVTASGNIVTEGYTVAMMDLPFGTRIYIEGLGVYEVQDRGVAENRVDIALESHTECYAVTGHYNVWIVD